MERDLRAKELALTGALLAFFAVALLGLAAGAESHIAALRGVAASAAVAVFGRFPARVFLDALQPPAQDGQAAAPESQPRETPARARGAKAA